MSVKKTSFSKKFFNTLDATAMSKIAGGVDGDPFDPLFGERRKLSRPKKEVDSISLSSSSFLVG